MRHAHMNSSKPAGTRKAKAKAKPVMPPGIDSRYELAYLQLLQDQKYHGLIDDYYLKPGSLRLGNSCHYEPDFMVIGIDGGIEFHEVKGSTRFAQKSLVKIKVAASKFPHFTFKLCWGNPKKTVDGKKSIEFDIKGIN